jgi:hypothetical protein
VLQRETDQLGRAVDPVSKYVDTKVAAHNGALYDASPWPGDDWYTREEFQSEADMLRNWGLVHQQIRPVQIDPARNGPIELGQSYRELLYKARFMKSLYAASNAAPDAADAAHADTDFKRGESLFYEMQCLKCHAMGGSQSTAAMPQPTAPNLDLAYRRLRRTWMRHWVQEPGTIQAGTVMPPFFTGLRACRPDGQPWPRSQGLTGGDVERIERLYGSSADQQARILLDFIAAAGRQHYTAMPPKSSGALPGIGPAFAPASTQPLGPMGKPILPGADPRLTTQASPTTR